MEHFYEFNSDDALEDAFYTDADGVKHRIIGFSWLDVLGLQLH